MIYKERKLLDQSFANEDGDINKSAAWARNASYYRYELKVVAGDHGSGAWLKSEPERSRCARLSSPRPRVPPTWSTCIFHDRVYDEIWWHKVSLETEGWCERSRVDGVMGSDVHGFW